jgi:hypothetical protein
LDRIVAKWKTALEASLLGIVSGALSNILTVIINIFVTTAKHIVRIIREGLGSLIKAIKFLVKPPKGLSESQVAHEAGKILIMGITANCGILFQDAIEKTPPMIAIRSIPGVGEGISNVLYSFFVAIVATLAMWGWDNVDVFGAKDDTWYAFAMNALQ